QRRERLRFLQCWPCFHDLGIVFRCEFESAMVRNPKATDIECVAWYTQHFCHTAFSSVRTILFDGNGRKWCRKTRTNKATPRQYPCAAALTQGAGWAVLGSALGDA